MSDVYMRTDEAAKFLGVSKQTLYKMIKDKIFTTVRVESSRGFGGKPSWEIQRKELEYIKEWREANKALKKKKVVEQTIEKPVEQKVEEPVRDTDEIRKLLEDLKTAMVLQAECLGKLIEKLI